MKRSIVALAALAILSAAAAVSTAAYAAKDSMLGAAPERGTGLPSGQCLRSRDIRNHTIADRNTLLIRGGDKQTYRVTMAGGCLAGATQSDPIITRNPPGADRICKPIDMDIGVARNGFETRCIVDSIVRLSPEQVAMVPKKLRP
jgi:hypothetical protein